MLMLIKEFAALTGVSVRTLRYYNEIGLLRPCFIDGQNGYRFYDKSCFLQMQQILFFRELGFSLKSIRKILSSPDFDRKQALAEQKQLLLLKKQRLEELIRIIDDAEKGEIAMKDFCTNEFESYKNEAKARWGNTDAYKEHAEKTKAYSKDKWNALSDGMQEIFAGFSACMQHGTAADAPEAQALVRKLQNHITESYYTCTNEILAGLGQMYVADERFQSNIDRHGAGIAAFISEAIRVYTKS